MVKLISSVIAASLLVLCGGPSSPAPVRSQSPHLSQATFAAGCFWGVEASFRKVPGVVQTTSGYTGGTTPNPTYRDVALGRTGHFEAVLVTYDPTHVTYAQLLDTFWSCHDPTVDLTLDNGGGAHRSAIFCHEPQQEAIARASLREVEESHIFSRPIVTQILPAQTFYPAEDVHQNYLGRNGIAGSCHIGTVQIHTRLAAHKNFHD